MAKIKGGDVKLFKSKSKVRRPGRHKKSNSKIKGTKNYKKRYRGQGK